MTHCIKQRKVYVHIVSHLTMIKLGLSLLLIGAALSADHGTFKDCSRVDFCTDLRGREPTQSYKVDSQFTNTSTTLTANLLPNGDGSTLVLTLTALQRDTFRLQIAEKDSNRYQLTDVLDGDPQEQEFDNVEASDNSVTVTSSGSNSVTINFDPFTIEFSKDGVSEVVFDGERLTMNSNSDNAPFSLGVKFPEGQQLYGIHEHCDTLALKNTGSGGSDPYRLKNSDVANFEINSPMALYGAIPLVYGHGPKATSAVFLHNAAEQWIETTSNEQGGSTAYFMAETGSLDLFVLLGPKPIDIVRQYTTLTGTAHMPQLWTLGYHQCRYSYDSQELVKEIIENLDNGSFPVDAIWLDIDYTDSFKYFTWNENTFSDPVDLQDTLASTNRKLVTIIDPHIKVETGYNVYDGALEKDLFVKNADGSVFEGQCWPGTSSYMDFLNPDAREFYGSMYSYDNFPSTTKTLGGIWNDMNEPSVFDNSLEMTLPADSLHMGTVTHRNVHNIYGFLHTMATHQGLMNRDNGTLRPFVLTRSHFAGSQRYAAFWTGDNTADWPYLLAEFQECLNANMLGIVFCGADVGGFFNNPSSELMERWYQAGAWIPFFRAHSNKDTNRREPYLWPEDTQDVLRSAMQLRYQHLPVWYTLFFQHTKNGDPIIRPLFYHYPEETETYKIDDSLLLGRDILVKAITESGVQSVQMYFPGSGDVWISINGNNDVQNGGATVEIPVVREYIPIYYRQGAVIVRKDTIRSNTAEMINDGYTIYYTLNDSLQAVGNVYVDDGESFKYQDEQDYSYYDIQVENDDISINMIEGNGDYPIVINKAVRRDIVQKPENGKPGRYVETVITTDANGVPLKDIKIFKDPVVIKIK